VNYLEKPKTVYSCVDTIRIGDKTGYCDTSVPSDDLHPLSDHPQKSVPTSEFDKFRLFLSLDGVGLDDRRKEMHHLLIKIDFNKKIY